MTRDIKIRLFVKQNILKNLTVLFVTIFLTQWVVPYIQEIGDGGVDAFLFLSIFPLGAMFGYFAFSYSNTNLYSTAHRALADATTFIFMVIIAFSVSTATAVGVVSIPTLKIPFILLAALLILGCQVYDFWDFYSNVAKKSD